MMTSKINDSRPKLHSCAAVTPGKHRRASH